MKRKALVALAALACAASAHSESFFQVEAGLGGARVVDMGDGTWQQLGAPLNKVNLQSVVAQIGVTGPVYAAGRFDLRYHLDYVYIGEYAASCACAERDEDYDLSTKTVRDGAKLGYYSGHGHLNGIAATLDAGYTYAGWRLAAEAGIWAYVQSWNQYARTSWGEWNLQSPRTVRYSYVIGARVDHGDASIAYRYYGVKQDWSNGVPGLASGVHALTFNYRF